MHLSKKLWKSSRIFIILFALAALIIIISNTQNTTTQLVTKKSFQLGTVITISLYGSETNKSFDAIFNRINEIENKMSFSLDNSEISRINENSGSPTIVSDETFQIIEKALIIAEKSSGNFDPTIGPIVNLWGIGSEDAKVPAKNDLEARLPLVNYQNVLLDSNDNAILLAKKGMQLDLGAIVKGYIADEINIILEKNNIDSAIINLGGNVYVRGKKNDDTPWKVGIQNPFQPRGTAIGVIDVEDKSVVASGVYERFFVEDGVNYHHILNPRDGYPYQNNLAAVTIVSTSSIEADAYSTVLFSLGLNDGLAFAEKNNVDAIFITKDKYIYLSDNIKSLFKLSDPEFKLIN